MLALHEILKKILEGESEGRKILEDANDQTEKIKREGQEKAEAIYKKAYEEAIADGERKSMDIKKNARKDAELEAESILHRAEEQIKEIQVKARKNFDAAVNTILDEIIS